MLTAGTLVGLAVTPTGPGTWVVIVFPPLALLFLHSRGRYVVGKRDLVLDSVASGFGGISISAMAIFSGELLVSDQREAFSALMAWTWSASLAGVTVVGITLSLLQQGTRRRGLIFSPTLIVGTDIAALDIALRLERQPEYGLRTIGFLTDTEEPHGSLLPPVLGGLDDLERVADLHGIRTVIIGFPEACPQTMLAFVARCDKLGLQTSIVPRLSAAVNNQTRFEYLGTMPLLNLRATNPDNWRFAVKHALDRILAGLLIVVLLPLLALLAITVKLSSPGPVLFRQPRTGRDARIFDLLKFRTMRVPDEAAAAFELVAGMAPGGIEGVDRRTLVGRMLRTTSLDELPQLVNVLGGEMSLVGPRPERPEFADLFDREIDRYHDRRRVRSGITGWAQVHGMRGQTPLASRIELDNFYIEHWSIALDLKIMLLTIPALLRGS
jgi:exopolysaccharide biosynthesis polyprenyl glycosylphosphotransferase